MVLDDEIRLLEEDEENSKNTEKEEYKNTEYGKYILKNKLELAGKLRVLRKQRDEVIKTIEQKFPSASKMEYETTNLQHEIDSFGVQLQETLKELRKLAGKSDYENDVVFKDEGMETRYKVLMSIVKNLEAKIRNKELKILEVSSRQ